MTTVIRSPELQAIRLELYAAFQRLNETKTSPEKREEISHEITVDVEKYVEIARKPYSIQIRRDAG